METEPNRLMVKITRFSIFGMMMPWILNEVGVFRVNKNQMRMGTVLAILVLLVPQIMKLLPKELSKPRTKYIFMVCALLSFFMVTYLLQFHTVLCLVLPLLFSTLYSTQTIVYTAYAGSLFLAFVTPVVSYLTNAWTPSFLQVLLQLCGYQSEFVNVPFFSTAESVWQIVLYLSLPRALIICVVGTMVSNIVKRNKHAIDDRIRLMKSTDKVLSLQSNILDGLAKIVESKDGSTGMHVVNVKNYAAMMMDYMLDHGLRPDIVTKPYADMVVKASILHDIGKVSIPDEILKKPGKFTDAEFAVMKRHPAAGDELIRSTFTAEDDAEFAEIAHQITYSHHEKFDGTGYPCGLSGTDIPFAARIMTIADSFEAMTAERCYKPAMPVERALSILEQDAGTHFDPELVPIFIAAYRENTENDEQER